jgi:FKBP-type peptidyl-prolyl cis-trans isomerase
MLSSAKYLIFALLVGSAFAAKKPLPSTHLPPDSPLRIGVTHRPETCPRKTKGGDRVSMHYAGTIYTTGKEFDSSIGRDTPFEFTLGRGEVILGWDQGLMNMCEGEKRKLTIPSELGYGEAGAGHSIKGGDTLVFRVELLEILNQEGEL